MGPNGAGKSTLVRLLCRLYDPETGLIKIDGNDIKNLDPGEYRKFFSVVFQDFMLYNLSAGENIRLGNTGIENPKEKIISAASSAEGRPGRRHDRGPGLGHRTGAHERRGERVQDGRGRPCPGGNRHN